MDNPNVANIYGDGSFCPITGASACGAIVLFNDTRYRFAWCTEASNIVETECDAIMGAVEFLRENNFQPDMIHVYCDNLAALDVFEGRHCGGKYSYHKSFFNSAREWCSMSFSYIKGRGRKKTPGQRLHQKCHQLARRKLKAGRLQIMAAVSGGAQ